MLKTLHIHCRRYEFYPGSGAEILHAAHAAKKKKNGTREEPGMCVSCSGMSNCLQLHGL